MDFLYIALAVVGNGAAFLAALRRGRFHGVRLLGPVEVLDGTRVLELGRRQKAVLAVLALQPGQVVPVTRLVDGLWGERLPASPEKALQIAVARLRAALGPSASLVVTRAPGYVLDLDGDAVDAIRFERLAGAGEDDGPGAVASRLRAGLGLWRGPALADVAGFPFAPPVITHLDEARWAPYERRVEADLACGLGGELVPELEEGVVDDHAVDLDLYRAENPAEQHANRIASAGVLHRSRISPRFSFAAV